MKWNKKGWSFLEQWKKKISSLFWLDDCAGGICLRERRWKTEILCVLHKDGGLMIPKWRIKKNETREEAAIREFQEETGLYNSRLWESLGLIKDRLRRKKIYIYTMYETGSKHSAMRDEAIMWVELIEAAEKMKHVSEKKFIEHLCQQK